MRDEREMKIEVLQVASRGSPNPFETFRTAKHMTNEIRTYYLNPLWRAFENMTPKVPQNGSITKLTPKYEEYNRVCDFVEERAELVLSTQNHSDESVRQIMMAIHMGVRWTLDALEIPRPQ